MPIKAIQQFMLGTVLNHKAQARETLGKMKEAGYDGIELCSFMIHPSGLLVQLITRAAGMPVGRGGKLDWPRLVKEAGLRVVSLLYHNHNCELQWVNDDQRAYDILLSETDPAAVSFEFDSYWFTEGGANALFWMERLGTRMKLWHINDRGTRLTGPAMTPILKSDSMELGYGNMDLVPMVEQAKAVCVDAVILESHRNWVEKSPVKSFQRSAAFLKKYV